MHKHFSIGIGIEFVTPRFQAGPEFNIIEDFAIVDDPDGFVFIVDGLITTREVKNTQTNRAHSYRVVEVHTGSVGAAMVDDPKHTTEQTLVGSAIRKINYSGYSTHLEFIEFVELLEFRYLMKFDTIFEMRSA
jgi:hypothetical protein